MRCTSLLLVEFGCWCVDWKENAVIAWGRTEGVIGDNRVVHGMRTD
jgi:hypothetical protein